MEQKPTRLLHTAVLWKQLCPQEWGGEGWAETGKMIDKASDRHRKFKLFFLFFLQDQLHSVVNIAQLSHVYLHFTKRTSFKDFEKMLNI